MSSSFKKLTKRQKQILDFIRDFIAENEYAPSYREIAENFNLKAVSTVHQHIEKLKSKGFLRAGYNLKRALDLVPAGLDEFKKAVTVPLVGLIAAGEPIEAIEDKEMVAVPADLVPSRLNTYVLKVKGDSMIDEGILDGDFVVVERNPSPKNGDVVVALLDNTFATLKKFFREKNRIRLQPANPALKPIYVRDPLIQGVVTGVVRNFKR